MSTSTNTFKKSLFRRVKDNNSVIIDDGPDEETLFDYQFRLILIGDSSVGKSSLLRYFTEGRFPSSELSDPTVGVDFYARHITLPDATKIKLQLWDTAGQERFRSITRSYYRNSVGVIIAYDVTNRRSLENIPIWIREAKKYIEVIDPVIILVGCKADLNDQRQITSEEGQYYGDQYGLHLIETSAKSGLNVSTAFQYIAQNILDKLQDGSLPVDDPFFDGIKTGYGFGVNRSGLPPEGQRVNSFCC